MRSSRMIASIMMMKTTHPNKIKNNVQYHRNFWILNLANAIFFSGYLILKFPLAFILAHQGISLNQAYSLTTTGTIAFALCSLALTSVMKNYHNQKHVLLLGIFLNLIAAICLETRQYTVEVIGMSCYVVGGSLYFFNITLFFNKQFSDPDIRLRGNYFSQICLNVGALIGSIVFLFAVNTGHHYFFYSIFFIIIALLFLISCYWIIQDEPSGVKQQMQLYCSCGLMFLLVMACLQYAALTRWLVLLAFIFATCFGLYQSQKSRERGYFLFIILILLFSFPYWIANTILYNQFFVFLHDSVFSFYGIPATFVILLDPLGNVIFGLCWGNMIGKISTQPYMNLQIGMVLIVLAFSILTAGLFFNSNVMKISVIYPVITLLLFSCGQFLIQPTMNSCVNNLIHNHHHMIFGLGVLRSMRAIAAITAFYLINFTTVQNKLSSLQQNMVLYCSVTAIALLAVIVFQFYKKRLCAL